MSPPSYTAQSTTRPSDARRMRLKQMDAHNVDMTNWRLSNLVPLERYFTTADQLRLQFQLSYESCQIDQAYLYGLRFCNFSTHILPTHDYYYASSRPTLKALRQKNILDAAQTMSILEELIGRMDEEELKRNSDQEMKKEDDDALPVETTTKQHQTNIPFSALKECFTQDYLSFIQSRRLECLLLSTYQGRVGLPNGKNSTNGCTVISSLIVAHHLLTAMEENISNPEIEAIIDDIAPDILTNVRSKLGLTPNAFIIPSDVHDYLLELQILQQDQFVNVVGGNILDPGHVQKLFHILDHSEGKLGVSFFFHEHVISILQLENPSNSKPRWDIVDSMPHETELGRHGAAIRIRCNDMQALEVALRWYAYDTLTPADEIYIDEHEWDDSLCDCDCRVFQAYIWKAT